MDTAVLLSPESIKRIKKRSKITKCGSITISDQDQVSGKISLSLVGWIGPIAIAVYIGISGLNSTIFLSRTTKAKYIHIHTLLEFTRLGVRLANGLLRPHIFRRSGVRNRNLEHLKRTLYPLRHPTWDCFVVRRLGAMEKTFGARTEARTIFGARTEARAAEFKRIFDLVSRCFTANPHWNGNNYSFEVWLGDRAGQDNIATLKIT